MTIYGPVAPPGEMVGSSRRSIFNNISFQAGGQLEDRRTSRASAIDQPSRASIWPEARSDETLGGSGLTTLACAPPVRGLPSKVNELRRLSHRNQAPPLASRGNLDAIGDKREHRPSAMEQHSRNNKAAWDRTNGGTF